MKKYLFSGDIIGLGTTVDSDGVTQRANLSGDCWLEGAELHVE